MINRKILIILALILYCLPAFAADQKVDKWAQGSKSFKEGQDFYLNSLFDQARESFEEALKIFKELDNKESIATTQSNLGTVYKYLGDYHKSIEYYKDARDSYLDLKDRAAIANCFSQLGTVCSLKGDYDQALSYFQDALGVWVDLADKGKQAMEQSNIGATYCNLEKYGQAIGSYQNALAIQQELADRAAESKCFTDLGLAYSGKGDYVQAMDNYQKAMDIKRELQDKKGEGVDLTYSGSTYSNQGDYAQALNYYQKALTVNQEIQDKKAEATSLTDLAITYSNQGDYDQALACYQKVLPIRQELDDVKGEGICEIDLGFVYANLGDYVQAITYYNDALEIKKESNDKKGEGRVLSFLGNIYVVLGDYNRALDFYQKALAIQEEIKEQADILVSLTNIGDIYFNQEEYEEALPYYQKAWLIRQELDDYSEYFYHGEWTQDLSHYHWRKWGLIEMEFGKKIGMSKELNILGEIYKNQADYFHSLSYYDKARALFLRLSIPFSFSLDNLGNTYLALGQFDQALDIFLKQDNPINLGRYYLLKKDYKTAKYHFSRRQDKFVEMKMDDFALAGWIGLGLACEGMGEFEVAKEYYLKAVTALEQQQETLPEISRRYFLRGKAIHIPRLEAYEGMVRMLVKLGDTQAAFTWTEKTKAVLLSEQLMGKTANGQSHIPADLAEKERNSVKKISANYIQQKIALQKGNKAVFELLLKEGQALKNEKTTLIEILRRDFPRYAALRYPQTIQAEKLKLKQQEIVIEYEVTEPYTLCFVVNDYKLVKTFTILQTRNELRQLVKNLRGFVGGNITYNYQAAHELYNLLLKEALSRFVQGSPLIIIPDEALSLLPFEALVMNEMESKGKDKEPVALPVEEKPKDAIPKEGVRMPESDPTPLPSKEENKPDKPAEAKAPDVSWNAGEVIIDYKLEENRLRCLVYVDGELRKSGIINKSKRELESLIKTEPFLSACPQAESLMTSIRCVVSAWGQAETKTLEDGLYNLLLADVISDLPPADSLLIIPDGALNLLPLENWALKALNRKPVVADNLPLSGTYQLAGLAVPKLKGKAVIPAKEEFFIEYEVEDNSTRCLVSVGDQLKKTITISRKREDLKDMIRRIRPLVEKWKGAGKIDIKLGQELYDLFLKEALAEIPSGSALVIIPEQMLEPIPFETLAKFFWATAVPRPETPQKPQVEEKKEEEKQPVAETPVKLKEKQTKPSKLDIVVKKEGTERAPNEVVIEYEAKDDHTVCTVEIGGKLEKTITIAKTRVELEKLIKRVVSAEEGGKGLDQNLEAEIYNLFLKNALVGLPQGSTLVIMLDNFLSRLPFEALAQNFAGKTPSAELLDSDLNATIEYEVEDSQTTCTIDWEGTLQKSIIIPKTRKELARLIKTFPSPLEPGDYAAKFSQELKDKLFEIFLKAPLDMISPDKGIIVITDEFLSLVPFDALLRNIGRQKKTSQHPQYLGEYWPCSYHQSAYLLSVYRDKSLPNSKNQDYLFLGDAVYDPEDPRLKGQEALTNERGKFMPSLDLAQNIGTKQLGYNFLRLTQAAPLLDEIGKLYPTAKIMKDLQADEEALKKQDLSKYRYIVLAAHGILGDDLPYIQNPAMALTLVGSNDEDGFLSTDEMLNLKLDAELVALPNCQTGKKMKAAEYGTGDISQALIFAGSDSVLGSLWTADTEFGNKLMDKFFEGLNSGQSRLSALQNAKLYLLNNGYEDPYYWAGFVLTGEPK